MATSDIGKSSQDAIFVAIMGRTGTGKTRFINKAIGTCFEEGYRLESCTRPAENYISVC
jgi:ABC-type lipoprotein export system ATPase subunit